MTAKKKTWPISRPMTEKILVRDVEPGQKFCFSRPACQHCRYQRSIHATDPTRPIMARVIPCGRSDCTRQRYLPLRRLAMMRRKLRPSHLVFVDTLAHAVTMRLEE